MRNPPGSCNRYTNVANDEAHGHLKKDRNPEKLDNMATIVINSEVRETNAAMQYKDTGKSADFIGQNLIRNPVKGAEEKEKTGKNEKKMELDGVVRSAKLRREMDLL